MAPTMYRKPKTLAELRACVCVREVYRDSDGLWVELNNGWKNTYDEPRGALHGIHENSLKDALLRWDGIKPCDCADCTAAVAKEKTR
jgi:hypothetical protein